MSNVFAASLIKMARAKKFIDELEQEIVAFLKRPGLVCYALEMPESEPGLLDIKISTINPDPEVGAIIGDVVHNLRTALDLMATQLVVIAGESTKDVYFPFSKSADEFDGAITSKKFHRAGADAVALLKTFSPYWGGNELLRGLHDLDIQDKHKALVLSLQQFDGAITLDRQDDGQWAVTPSVTKQRIIFPKDSEFSEQEVIPTLKSLVVVVEGILEAFSGLVAARAV